MNLPSQILLLLAAEEATARRGAARRRLHRPRVARPTVRQLPRLAERRVPARCA